MVKLSNQISAGINRNFTKSTSKINSTLLELSSGKRLNKAKDDAAALAIVASLTAEEGTGRVAVRNISDASSRLSIAEGTVDSASGIVSRLGELSAQASNGTLSDGQRMALDNEYQSLVTELDRLESQAVFNGEQVLGSSVSFQTGTDGSASSQTTVSVGSVTSSSLSLQGTSIATQSGAQAALDLSKAATQTLASSKAEIGANESRLGVSYNNLQVRNENNAAARSQLEDADIADASARLIADGIRRQGGAALLGLSNRTQATIIQTLLQN